jgi:hypothetical protein
VDIDLLVTNEGDIGLVSDGNFAHPVAGILFDVQTHMMTLEFADMDSLDLNIPVGDDYIPSLIYAMALQVGIVEHGQVEDSRQVPLLLINDTVTRPGRERPMRLSKSVTAFERFMKACVAGQPVHRDDLGDEKMESVMAGAGMNKAVLQLAPHLARQRTLEAQPNHVPNFAPGMGMGGGSGRSAPLRQRPPEEDERD